MKEKKIEKGEHERLEKICSKEDYRKWLDMDLRASKMIGWGGEAEGKISLKGRVRLILNKILLPNDAKVFLVTLRKYEYVINTAHGLYGEVKKIWWQSKYNKIARRRNIDAFPNTLGPGICLNHGNVVISSLATVGKNCMIQAYVTIGITNGIYSAPQIGDFVFIGTGAKIIGDITIADGVCIGANSVVTKSILEPNITVAGAPARKISNQGTEKQIGMIVKIMGENDIEVT